MRKMSTEEICDEVIKMRKSAEQIRDEQRKKEHEKRKKNNGKKSESICWSCERVDCPWMRKTKPVEGWEAEHHKRAITKGKLVDCYIVRYCPLFRKASNKPIYEKGEKEI